MNLLSSRRIKIFKLLLMAIAAGSCFELHATNVENSNALSYWRAGAKIFSFRDEKTTGILISAHCSSSCQAARVLKKISLADLKAPKNGFYAGSVASHLCVESARGKVVVLHDGQGNENSFCAFKDGSMISCSSLEQVARTK
ncbi:MAG TPA: hypothetical protein VJB59_04230 [Bdellovibrionota bacterium]|nr:hypothetical protein [Bdellovibrionota bacterium]